ncbi:MAG: sulfurtransferase [Uliginosibacterium sp.]|nr:sulfurtransferase [Uliginosibacterium sp.]
MAANIVSLSARELADWLADPARPQPLLLDVREGWEFEHCHLPGACHVPMGEVPARLAEIAAAPAVVCICHHGMRSMQVAAYLARQSEGQVFNLRGGVDAWSIEVDAALPRY